MAKQLLIYRDGNLKFENLVLDKPYIKTAEYFPLLLASTDVPSRASPYVERTFVLVAKTNAYDVYEER